MSNESARGLWVLGDTERARSEWEFHAATPASQGGERSWSWAAVSLSRTTMGPPHLGQRQRGRGSLAADACCSTCGCGIASSSRKQSGRRVARRRLARKPKWRMRTKPLGSRCNRKRRRNSSSARVINLCSLLCAESRQRKVTWLSADETSRWLEMATRWVYWPK